MTDTLKPYTVAEAAAIAGISADSIYRMIREGKFPCIRLGERSMLIPRRKFEAWLNGDWPTSDHAPIEVRFHEARH